jgi:hypothetical protein
MQFTKLFNSILDSTIWQEPLETKVVWITMLAMVDRGGEVHASIPGLAKRAGVSLDECEQALECLKAPDRYSRTQEHDGRRVAEIDGGWRLLNHGKYRALLSAEERREYNRLKQAEYRKAKPAKDVNDMSMTVNDNVSNAHITESEAESDTEALNTNISISAKGRAKSEREVIDYIVSIGLTENDGIYGWNSWEASEWQRKGQKIKDWKAHARAWKSAGYFPSQKSANGKPQQPLRRSVFADMIDNA